MGYEQLGMEGWTYLNSGGEASVYMKITDLGKLTNGLLHCDEGITVVYRVSGDLKPSFLGDTKAVYEVSGDSEHSFLRNLAAAILDAAFVRDGKYANRHIPSPIGLSQVAGLPADGYLYEYVAGSEGFPWDFPGDFDHHVTLEEWIDFCNAFASTGIGVQHDIADPDNARASKNIIVQSYTIDDLIKGTLSPHWGRIDFGFSSCPVSWEKFGAYFTKHEEELKSLLGSMGDVLLLAYNAGMGQLAPRKVTPREVMERYHRELQIFPDKFFNCL